MNYERKKGDVAIFKNNKTKDNQPDYTGTAIDLQGNEVKISLWVKESTNGKKFFSGKIAPKYENGNMQENADLNQCNEDDLPF